MIDFLSQHRSAVPYWSSPWVGSLFGTGAACLKLVDSRNISCFAAASAAISTPQLLLELEPLGL